MWLLLYLLSPSPVVIVIIIFQLEMRAFKKMYSLYYRFFLRVAYDFYETAISVVNIEHTIEQYRSSGPLGIQRRLTLQIFMMIPRIKLVTKINDVCPKFNIVRSKLAVFLMH